ncbi:facilitated trehalose transporter Tret1 [Bemisia tabaci]|uniref:facilitated trehalose transporter Tret1 n=1 Tax=Bemisia tabaci TaxID=7038 RepID=UPI003B28B0C4
MCLALGIKRQLIAAVACALATLVGGMINGWPAPTLKKLRQPGSPIHLTTEQETWLVTALHVGTLLSPFPAGFMMNKLGRKASLLALGVLPVISFGLIYLSTTPEMLILARLFAGLWIGGSHTVVPIYIAEISEPEVRGILSALNQVLSFLGNILVYAVGPYVSIRSTAVFCGAVAVIFLVLFASCPESPYFHIIRGHPERAVTSLIWLRGGPPTPAELGAIRGYLAARGGHGWRRITDLLTTPENRKAFVIVEVLSGLDRLSGTVESPDSKSSRLSPRGQWRVSCLWQSLSDLKSLEIILILVFGTLQFGYENHTVYCGTKTAVDGMTRAMTLELGKHNVRVNCVCPVVVLTPLGRQWWSEPSRAEPMLNRIPLGRFAEIEDIVNPVLFLLTDNASMINGARLPVDGGHTTAPFHCSE